MAHSKILLIMHHRPMIPDYGTQYEDNLSSHHGGMHTDRLTDWTLSYFLWFHLGSEGNNNKLQRVIYHTFTSFIWGWLSDFWCLLFLNEINVFLYIMSNMSKGFYVLKIPVLLVLINSCDMVNVHKLTWTTILCLLEVHWEKNYLQNNSTLMFVKYFQGFTQNISTILYTFYTVKG